MSGHKKNHSEQNNRLEKKLTLIENIQNTKNHSEQKIRTFLFFESVRNSECDCRENHENTNTRSVNKILFISNKLKMLLIIWNNSNSFKSSLGIDLTLLK